MKKAQPNQHIPQVDKVLRHPAVEEMSLHMRRDILTSLIRLELKRLRQDEGQLTLDEVADKVCQKARSLLTPRLRRVINGTGVVLNTNLGRAPLPENTLSNISLVGRHYSNLEFDLEEGKRGERTTYIEELLSLLTGCQSALVVNNNAAAVMLAVNTFAQKKEVIVSRGELVEIGGSFRIPEVIVSAGGKLKEVGTTNKTRAKDYQHAISSKTALLLRCHRSNFAISGFWEEASRQELVALAQKYDLPLVEDLGSGALTSLSHTGANEPTVADVIRQGVNIVTVSGDKLLGGPQAGILLGDRKLIKALRKNPLYRCLRPDKLIISTIESLLCNYLTPDYENIIPVLSMTKASAGEIKERVDAFVQEANEQLKSIRLSLTPTTSKAGGGSLPGSSMASFGIKLTTPLSATRLAKMLRNGTTPVIPIIENDQVIIDFRTITNDDERVLLDCLKCIDEIASLPQDIRPENRAIISGVRNSKLN